MRYFATLIFLIFANCAFAQNTHFEWVNPKTALRERIELNSNHHLKEISPGKWIVAKKLAIDNTIFKDLPTNNTIEHFYMNNGKDIWFTVDGTGMVYQFTPATHTFVRLDNTFYRGYNFFALKFIRQNKLYSLGGQGFWAYSYVLTYFEVKSKEWQIVRADGEHPEAINHGYKGYSAKADQIFNTASSIIPYDLKMQERIDNRVFMFDFKKSEWALLGHINSDLPGQKLAHWNVFWDGEHFIQFFVDKLYFIEPIANSVQMVEYSDQIFIKNRYSRIFKKGDTLYNYFENGFTIDKFSKKDLLKKAKYIGPFYTNEPPYIWIVIVFLMVLVGLGIAFVLFKRKRKLKLPFTNDFDQMELDLIQHLVALAENTYLTNNEMNDILGLNDKSQDNQRKIKMNLINQINQKIDMKYQVKDAIGRISISEDKRLKAYYMKPEVVKLLRK
jgi:hypothetical protein